MMAFRRDGIKVILVADAGYCQHGAYGQLYLTLSGYRLRLKRRHGPVGHQNFILNSFGQSIHRMGRTRLRMMFVRHAG
jgi:hypothetical protein